MSPAGKALLTVAIVMVGTGVGAAIVGRRKGASDPEPGDDDGGDVPSGGGGGVFENQDKAIAVGEIGDPKVAPLVAEIQALWDSRGIPRDIMVPAQFYTMSKATHTDGADPDDKPGPILAIASRATWERTADFLADLVVPLFAEVARRGGKRSDYRTGGFREGYGSDGKGKNSYNQRTGGAPKSRHVDGDALDIIPLRKVSTNTDILLMALATLMVRSPNAKIGGGFYAGNAHIDLSRRRTWSGKSVPGKAEKYLKRAKQELDIA